MKFRRAAAAVLAWALLSASALASDVDYLVKPGDTLMSIASQMLAGGAKDYRRLAAHNNLKDANVIAPGATLRIPVAWLKRQPASAKVISVAGEVKAGERVLKSGDTVAEGEELTSGPAGYATLQFADGSMLRVGALSRVTVESHKAAPSLADFETRLRLGAGAIEAVVAKQRAQDFRVRTPTANMAVRGTEFRVRSGEAASQAEVTGGRVGVAGDKGGEVAVNEGFGTVVRQGEAPLPPVKLLDAPDLSGVAERQERPVVRIAFPAVAGAAMYRLLVTDDKDLRNVVVDAPMHRPVMRIVDLRDGEYFYAVRAIDKLGLEGREARGRFLLKARPLPPISLAPAGARLAPGPVEFTWENGEEAASYRFQLSTDERFGALLIDRAGIAERRVVADRLEPGNYYWRVASTRADGDPGPFGETLPFSVQPPAPPEQGTVR